MRTKAVNEERIKVCLVQPVQSPYWTERLRALVRQPGLDVVLLLEQDSLAHRPDWVPQAIQGLTIEVLGSRLIRSTRNGDDLGYRIDGIRLVPWRLPMTLARLRPDVVIVCNATQLLLTLPGRRPLGYRLALIVEDTLHATRNLGRLARLSRAWAYRRADLRFAFSEDARAYLDSIGGSAPVVRSSWSLDMHSLGEYLAHDAIGGTRSAQAEFRPMTVLFAGRLVEGKGIRHLLQSWLELPYETKGRAKLVIAGSGPLSDDVADFIRVSGLDGVEMLGNVPYTEMMRLFGQADLFVLPTLQDHFSLTVLEAMSCGCPVVTTPFNGARELVEEGKTGWIADPTKAGELTRVLERALLSPVSLASMGKAARERVASMDNEPVMRRFAEDLRMLAIGDLARSVEA